ncbi:FAD-dependent oxidoreductase domain-containing protein 2 isoform X2 [Nematostella vectensis]|uniref:FAD-dependent oxidoreductase domain-containing protein 2 isoform X2 n=1 Tax=Nematostella vectensis TaxID=45351 RepID=UPI0020774EFB|nr:FAD-dependent oxidoreductase domain-containing protein 2 isoform X2 [Nematostella vectensis]
MRRTGFLADVFILAVTGLFQVIVADDFHEYCIVGAGPGGLQLGFFFERAGRDYVIYERDGLAGSFFRKYPRHRKLISINKRFTGRSNKEFNLRHDWNSLISDDESLLFREYSDEFYPPADNLVKYLNDYAKKLKLNVQYNTNITKISRGTRAEDPFYLYDQNAVKHTCTNLIMSTGLATENLPENFKGVEHTESYNDISTNPKDFEGQTVLIIGRGNSAFETAASILGSTNHIHMFARAVNNEVLDTYQLKSLDGLLEVPVEIIEIKKSKGKLYVDTAIGKGADNFAIREPYDRVIRCMGFKFDFSVFDNTSQPRQCHGMYMRKFPSMKPNYESTRVPRMYFTGVVTHAVDFRKSAGGFIHGFRYTARTLHRILEQRNHNVTWPHTKLPLTELMGVILRRINEASGIYQMFGILGEVMIFRPDNTVEYYEEFPIRLIHKFEEYSGSAAGPMLVINMEYGKDYSGPGKDVFRGNRAAAAGVPSVAHHSNFLHPVLYFYKTPPTVAPKDADNHYELPRPDDMHVMVEDFLTLWDAPIAHYLLLRRFLEKIQHRDLRLFFAQSCFKMAMTHTSVPEGCEQQYLKGQMLVGAENVVLKAKRRGLLM